MNSESPHILLSPLLLLLLVLLGTPAAAQQGICAVYSGSACNGTLPAGYVLWANTTEDISRQEMAMQYVANQIKVLKAMWVRGNEAAKRESGDSHFGDSSYDRSSFVPSVFLAVDESICAGTFTMPDAAERCPFPLHPPLHCCR